MPRHIYLRAYMAGVMLPSALVVLMLAGYCILRLGLQFPVPIERWIVFPLALVPCIWGLWNMLYLPMRPRAGVSIGVHGAVVPLLLGPLALAVTRGLGVEIPRIVLIVFPVALVIAAVVYYLLWKYAVGFLNRMLEIA